jgi:putative ABC transport system substrate-binding protein
VTANVQQAARVKAVRLRVVKAGTESEIEAALSTVDADALIIQSDPFFGSQRRQLASLVSRHAIPAIYDWREFVSLGGLISYGTDLHDVYRQVGVYAGRLLSGEKPANLPLQQPTKFDLIINARTARTLGLTIPETLLTLADEVIE